MSTARTFDIATEHHRNGQLQDAERLYRQVLGQNPRHDNALFLLSVIALQAGRLDEAARLLQEAIALAPDHPAFHSNLGEVYRRLGRHQDAVNALLQSVSLKPDAPEPIFNLGLAFRALGEVDASLACLERAADLRSNSFAVQYEFASSLRAHEELIRSVGHYQCALALNPSSVETLVDLANVLHLLGRLDASIALGRRAIEMDPNFALAHNNLGSALLDKLEFDEAVACFQRALQLDPSFAHAHNNLGNAMKDGGRVDEAVASFRRAHECDPADAGIHSNLVYTFSFQPGVRPQVILEEARRWNRLHAARFAAERQPHANDRSPERRLRIGYVSPDYRDHCQAFFMTPLLAQHDHQAFEIFCYSSVAKPDAVTERLRGYADHWSDIAGLDDEAAARRIRDDQIDILVDLTMHMAHGRLLVFARKPAPLQVSWLAYPGTTGLDAIDYRITDPFLDPPELARDARYAERSLRLADSFWCYDSLGGPAVNALPALTGGHVSFGCLNNYCKVTPEVLALFADVLAAVPRSKLFLLAPPGEPRRDALKIFEQRKIDPERLQFLGRASRGAYLSRYHQIDIGLDTLPYNGHTTSLDAFWMGVPVVTLVGDTVVGRAGLCHAMNLRLPELVATTPHAYVERAAALANDLPRLAAMRAELRNRMEKSPLMDATRFVRQVEEAYRAIWRAHCAKSAPSDDR
jgi:protein O-GlcNAc transferase